MCYNLTMKKILIGLSLPYANGRLHIGHVASSLPADVLARFHRAAGNDVAFIGGSDCFGTPILVKAKEEGIPPLALSDKYHDFFVQDFGTLGFTFDNFSKTSTAHHQKFAAEFHAELYKQKTFVFDKSEPQLYCGDCKKYLPDRYVEGICPHCHKDAKGDSCDGCGKMLEPEELLSPRCKLCSGSPIPRMTRQLYLKLSVLEPELRDYYNAKKEGWANNAVGLTGRYLNEGLRDRAITRNIEWGVELPKQAAKRAFNLTDAELAEKKIYIWAENVLGYYSFCKEKCEARGEKWEDYLLDSSKTQKVHYYVHAKDNIPFHSVIFPGLLLANQITKYHLPDIIVSSEYVTVDNEKISKSKGNLITAEELTAQFDSDMIRWYFLRNVSDRKDTNFTLEDFRNTVNAELVNGFGNLVNRTLSFAASKFDGVITKSKLSKEIQTQIQDTFDKVGKLIEDGKIAKALSVAYDLVVFANKHFDTEAPWATFKTDIAKSKQTIGEVTTIIANLARILSPFIPSGTAQIGEWLGIKTNDWKPLTLTKDIKLPEIQVLFKRLG